MGIWIEDLSIKNIGPRLSSGPYADRECPVHNAVCPGQRPLRSCCPVTQLRFRNRNEIIYGIYRPFKLKNRP